MRTLHFSLRVADLGRPVTPTASPPPIGRSKRPKERGRGVARRLPGNRVGGGEPATQFVVKVSGRGDTDAVGE